MPKFLLLGGKFEDQDGKEYNAGDGTKGRPQQRHVITSDLELDVMFRNKFERLGDTTRHGPDGEEAEGDAQTDDPPAAVKAKMDRAAAAGKKTGDGYRAGRNRKMMTRERAEIMDEEVDEDGTTEESKPVIEKLRAKTAKQAEVEPEDDEEETEVKDGDEAEATDEEAEETSKPARTRTARGRTARTGKRK